VEVELLVIPDCPGADEARALLRTALDDVGLSACPIPVTIVDTDDAARTRRFAGSPTFLVDGTDLFEGGPTSGSMACRVYATPEGPRNVPALRDLREALEGRAGRHTGA
jgi:hypothetical protein